MWGMIGGIFKSVGVQPTRKYTFEYRVLAKKDNLGRVYYTGESTTTSGRIVGLYKEPYAAPCPPPPGHTVASYYAAREPSYIFVAESTVHQHHDYHGIGAGYTLAKFDDPIKAMEAVCKKRKDNSDKVAYKAYREVISEGECKC